MARVISEKPRITKANTDFLILGTNDPSGIPQTVTISYGNFFANVSAVASFSNTVSFANATANTVFIDKLVVTYKHTPINSVETTTGGSIYFDDTYLYVTTANNTIKRVTLEAF